MYDCRWGTDTIRVVVAGELPREAHNAPLHLFSAAPELVGFGGGAYRRRSEQTSRLLGQLFERLRGEGFAVSFTMEDFKRQYIKEHFPQLTPEERAGSACSRYRRSNVWRACRRRSACGVAAGGTLGGPVRGADGVRQYLDRSQRQSPAQPRKPRRKK